MVKFDGSPTKYEDAINTYEIFYHPQRCEWFRRLLTTNKHYTIGYEEAVSYFALHYYEVIGNIHEVKKVGFNYFYDNAFPKKPTKVKPLNPEPKNKVKMSG